MKELSIEEKAKAYDDALSVAQETYTTQPMYRDWLAKMFPELKESEDERIRKRIIHALHGDVLEISEIKEAVAWLEKQGEQNHANSTKTCEDEQKPADKVEPIDEYEGLTDFERAVADACIGFIDKDLVGWKPYVKDKADDLLKIAVKKFNKVQDDTTIAINNEEAYKIGFSDGEAHAKEEMTSAWSEDDEGICRAIINDIANDKSICTFDISKGICDKKIKWLKAIKDRVACEANCTTTKQWKPSDMELEVLRLAAEKDGTCLMGLYEQLKKLREE